ncbi:FAD synthetase family protein [Salinicoccus carnicancri]|uniref:FAD synthetase family protein n=1 Tax=Salinicoccus carnicancri TaxID=558170 RepID=UPI00058C5D37|nr:FAD synthetase family protein [Salinicoccus carnicancri]
MEIIYVDDMNLKAWQRKSSKNVMALGFFDGVHRGHQKVIAEAKRQAEKHDASLDVMSFFPHPKTVISNGKKRVDYLMPLEEKARVLEKMGVDRFYIVKFTKAFASMEPHEYVEEYLEKLGTIQAVAGYDFSYGFKGEGNMDRLAADSGFSIGATKVDKVTHMGSKISSTCIRSAILEGRISELRELLGRNYSTKARVTDGYLSLNDYYMLPQDGIYNVTIEAGFKRYEAQIYVDNDAQKISFTQKCLMDKINRFEIAITWERRIASYTLYQMVAQ